LKHSGPYRIIISGGGTGGHIFPAIAIANAFRERHPDAQILFVGAQGRMEMTRVPEAGYEIIGLWISGLQRSLKFSNLILPVKLVMSYFKAKSIIRKFRPHAVVGTGGYASGPILLAASRMHIPCLIQEQNSYAGLANKQVAEKVSRICVAYEGMDKYFPKEKIVFTGNPVRKDILSVDAKREQSLVHFGFDASIRTLLIVGGSLGARTINESMLAGFDKLMDARIQVIWQTGKTYYASVKSRLGGYDLRRIRVYDFLKEVDLAYAAADVVISRAGAIAVSELCLAGKAVILVPSPNVAEDHQTKNALALVKHEAAVLVKDAEAPDRMVNEALKLLFDEARAKKLGDNIRQLAKPQATDDIVMELEKLMDAKNTGPATVSGKVTAMMLN
jgi:UDP-N-acetylglucosamine--N-acetylmuramyl-(pentapeptide) pyrophosphoryl-undecaprenol N-acetylglucosamine transferase